MKVWKSLENTAEEALNLPEGSYAANFGFLCEQSVKPEHVIEAAEAILATKNEIAIYSQAGMICKAQEIGVAFTDWAPLKVI